jgi:uncharacterized protein (DUF3084 family)
MTTAKYQHALDILYKDLERELKIQTTKVKEAEAEVRPLRTELLMLNSQLSTMRGEKEQYKQELQKALERPQQEKRSRKRRRRTYGRIKN